MHSSLFYENSPNKFFDGIAASLPAVFNRSTWLESWLNKYDCGVVCDCDKPGLAIAKELKKLHEDRNRLNMMSEGARRLAEDVFSRDLLSEKYEILLNNINSFFFDSEYSWILINLDGEMKTFSNIRDEFLEKRIKST
jgi:hypothetical protein